MPIHSASFFSSIFRYLLLRAPEIVRIGMYASEKGLRDIFPIVVVCQQLNFLLLREERDLPENSRHIGSAKTLTRSSHKAQHFDTIHLTHQPNILSTMPAHQLTH